jgi:lysophospholipase L1-like esterase
LRVAHVCLALALLAGAGCRTSPSAAGASPAMPRIGFVGDSLTIGLYATSQAQAYPELVASALHAQPVIQATSGIAATSLDPRMPLPTGVKIVVVELGTNDLSQRVEDFQRSYQALVGRLKRASPRTTSVCLGVWRGAADSAPLTGVLPAAFDEAIARVCPGSFVALASLYRDPSLHGPAGRPTWKGAADWFHPNDEGHRRIADAVLEVLQNAPA